MAGARGHVLPDVCMRGMYITGDLEVDAGLIATGNGDYGLRIHDNPQIDIGNLYLGGFRIPHCPEKACKRSYDSNYEINDNDKQECWLAKNHSQNQTTKEEGRFE